MEVATKHEGTVWKTMDNNVPIEDGLMVGHKTQKAEPVANIFSSMEDLERIFSRVQKCLKAQVGEEVYQSWFGRLKLHSSSRNIVRLSVPTTFLRSWINSKYVGLLTELFQNEEEAILKVEVIVRSATRVPAVSAPKTAGKEPKKLKGPSTGAISSDIPTSAFAHSKAMQKPKVDFSNQKVVGSPLDDRYGFSNFIEGASNRVALAAAKTISESGLGAIRFNPLFIHSNVGLGKTHLLQSIAAAATRNNPNTRVVYLTAEYFMWRFASAIRDKDALSFKESLRDIDLLVIDDMQFLQGKSIQNEFCHLLNMLLDSAKQVVVAADRAPWELESLDPRVRSRLQGGVAIEIEAPDYEMRLKILRNRLEIAQQSDPSLDIPDEILQHIAKTIISSGRELEGAFNQLVFRRSFEPDLDIERVDSLLGHLVQTGEPKRVRIEDIQRAVSRHFNVSRQELISNRRTRVIVKPRQIAMYLAKTMTPRSFPEIGRRFGGRDHTTVLHAVRKIEDLMKNDTKLSHEVELLKRLINE